MVAPAPATPGVRTRRAAAAEAPAAKAPPPTNGSSHANGDGARTGPAPTATATRLPLVRLAARGLVLTWLAAVWLWHLTPRASVLPGATGHLWFFRYLTFYSLTLQLAATALAAAREGGGQWRRRRGRAGEGAAGTSSKSLARWADDLGCAAFCFAHVVTLMFHIIQRATGGRAVEGAHLGERVFFCFFLFFFPVSVFFCGGASTLARKKLGFERSPLFRPPLPLKKPRTHTTPPSNLKDRPFWLDASVHRLNTLAAWADLALLSDAGARSFSRPGERLSAFLVALYCAVLASSKWLNGAFPYPFMNAMKQPGGFMVVCGGGMVIFGGAFRVGRAVGKGLRAAEDYFVCLEDGRAAAAKEQEQEQEQQQGRSVAAKEAAPDEGPPPRGGGKKRGGGGGGNPLGRAAGFLLRRRPPAQKDE